MYPVVLMLLYILFWKIAGLVFAHIFLISGFLIVAGTQLFSPNAELESPIHLKYQFKYMLTIGTIVLYTIVSLLVFTNAAKQVGSLDFTYTIVSSEFLDFIWIYILLLTLFSIQLSLLLKGIFKTNE